MLTLDNGTTVDMAGDARYVVRDPNGELAGVFRQADRAFLAAQRIDVVVSRRADMRGVEAEASRRLADDRAAYDALYGDAERALVALLSPIQAASFHRTGLIPLAVVLRELSTRELGGIRAEEMSALIRSGTWDVDADHDRHGSSRPTGDWASVARFYPGRHNGARYVRVPWKLTAADWADRLDAYMHDVAEEATRCPVSLDGRWTPAVAL